MKLDELDDTREVGFCPEQTLKGGEHREVSHVRAPRPRSVAAAGQDEEEQNTSPGDIPRCSQCLMAHRFADRSLRLQAALRFGRCAASVVLLTACCLWALVQPAHGQDVDDPTALPAFEVVSIKPRSGDRSAGRSTPLRVQLPDTTLLTLIRYAYDLEEAQVLGLPEWARTDRFEFIGVANDPVTSTHRGLMVRRALFERFSLRTRLETREMPVYVLSAANRGRIGERIERATVDCTAIRSAGASADVSDEERLACLTARSGYRSGVITQALRSVALPEFARVLSRLADRLVVDETGLEGLFDIQLEIDVAHLPWNGELPPGLQSRGEGPSLTTALREQLGLRLEAARRPVQVLIVDGVARPVPN